MCLASTTKPLPIVVKQWQRFERTTKQLPCLYLAKPGVEKPIFLLDYVITLLKRLKLTALADCKKPPLSQCAWTPAQQCYGVIYARASPATCCATPTQVRHNSNDFCYIF